VSRVVVNEIEAKVGNDVTFNDTVKIDTLKGKTTAGSVTVQGEGTATTNLQQGLCKTWANLKGTDTFGLRDSFNVTSATDNGTGDHTITIASDMANVNYSLTSNGADKNISVLGGTGINGATAPAVGSVRIGSVASNGNDYDHTYFMIAIHGDLA